MAILVMGIIIILNIGLLLLVMRVGTQGEHHSELSADQSMAVVALYDKLGLPRPEAKSVAVVREHAKDVTNTIDPEAELPPTDNEATKDVAEHNDEIAKAIDGDDEADVIDDLAISADEAKEEVDDLKDAASNLKEEVADAIDDDSDDD